MSFLAAALLIFSSLAGCGKPADPLFARAEKALQDGLYSEAFYLYREITENSPGSPRADEALYTSAEISLLFLNNVSMALDLFNKLIDQYPKSPYYLKAKKQIAEVYAKPYQDCSRSVVEFKALIDNEARPETRAEYQYTIAECYFKNDEFQQALAIYKAVEWDYPASNFAEDAIFQQANIYYLLGKYEDALRQYGKLEERYPAGSHITDAITGKASSLEELGRYKEALAQYQKLLKYGRLREFANNAVRRINSRLAKR